MDKLQERHKTMKKTDGNRKVRDMPHELATPSVLDADAIQAVSESINGLVADAFALYVKTKNFHWHLSGSHFRDYHLLFDEQADAIFASIDPLAERVRRIGGTTIHSIGQIGDLTSIGDDNDAFVPPDEMIRRLLEDNRTVAQNMQKAIELTEEKGDYPTSNLLQTLLDETQRRVWFLYEVSIGGEHEK